VGWKQIALGAGIGYVLGTKAGEDRYEQIEKWWKDLTASPVVERATERAKEQAQHLVAVRNERRSREEDEESEDEDRDVRAEDAGDGDEDDEIVREDDEGSDDGADSMLGRVGRFLTEARERGRIA